MPEMLERILLYAGLDSQEFDALKGEALAETRRSLRVYSMFVAIMFAIIAVFEWATDGYFAQNVGYYFIMAAICAFTSLVTRRLGPTHPDLILPLAYLLVIAMYVFALILTMQHTDLPAVTFIALLVLMPFLFTDRPIYIILVNIAATAALCLLSWMFKPRDIAIGDEWNSITLCIVSVGAAVVQRKLRFRALSQARHIRYLSETDLLTGAKNRNMYEQRSAEYPKQCERFLTCVFVDVNGLHATNDEKGHKAGDIMLQTVAKALIERFSAEHVYRIGGDEFVAFAPDATEDAVKKNMRLIAGDLEKEGYSISVGVVSAQAGEVDLQRMIDEADKDMYRQKQEYYAKPGNERRRR